MSDALAYLMIYLAVSILAWVGFLTLARSMTDDEVLLEFMPEFLSGEWVAQGPRTDRGLWQHYRYCWYLGRLQACGWLEHRSAEPDDPRPRWLRYGWLRATPSGIYHYTLAWGRQFERQQ